MKQSGPSVLRSALYLPASNDRAVQKAKTLPADAIIFDLEDAVAVDKKLEARKAACAAVKNSGAGQSAAIIRINGLDTAWGEDDLAAACEVNPNAVLVPKVNSAADIQILSEKLNGRNIELWAMIETARSILNVSEIADCAANTPLSCLVIGPNDLAKETRIELSKDREALLPILSKCVMAARAAGIQILDGVYNDFKDASGFEKECLQGKRFGMDGKSLIHPSQIEVCNQVFGPSLAELKIAQRIVDVFERPENHSANVLSIDGKMVERLHAEMAKDLLARGQAIGLI